MAYTIPDAAEWPELLERERTLSWLPDFMNEAGPPALDSTRQYRNSNGGGLWRSAFSGVQIRTAEHRKAWRALQITLRGGMTPVDVPVCAERPRQVGGGTAVVIVAHNPMAARDVSGQIRRTDSRPIEPGMFFSDYDATTYGWRLHLVDTVATVTSARQNITFWPPLRFAVAADHPLEFASPRCVMRLIASDSMDLDLEQRRFGNPNAEFIEAF